MTSYLYLVRLKYDEYFLREEWESYDRIHFADIHNGFIPVKDWTEQLMKLTIGTKTLTIGSVVMVRGKFGSIVRFKKNIICAANKEAEFFIDSLVLLADYSKSIASCPLLVDRTTYQTEKIQDCYPVHTVQIRANSYDNVYWA